MSGRSTEEEEDHGRDPDERRRSTWLSKDQINEIAQRAAAHALRLVYEEVGRNVVRAALWIIGAGCLALLAYLGLSGKVPLK